MRISVRDFGAKGDGVSDDFHPFQAALFSGAEEIYVPMGEYHIFGTLRIPSSTSIIADRCARIVMRSTDRRRRGEFLLTNDDCDSENHDISIIGGIWDGRNSDPYHKKPDLFDKDGYSGAVLNFVGVKRLSLKDMVISNSTTYYIRMSRVTDFTIENIDFISDDFGNNQDGLHFGGGVRRGRVKNIRALSRGQTNDDMIALNADDSVERIENLDLERSGIEDISFENIYAENCYTIVRLLSVTAPIRNISFKNIHAGFRCYAVNADGARYCKTPLFKEEEYPMGIGKIENVLFENFLCYPITSLPDGFGGVSKDTGTAIALESRAKKLVFKNFSYVGGGEEIPAMIVENIPHAELVIDEKLYTVGGKEDKLVIKDFSEMSVNTD